MKLLIKLAFKDLLQSRKLVLFFIFNLSLGLSSFVALQSFNKNIKSQLQENQKEILGADFVVSSRRPITSEELEKIEQLMPANFQKYRSYEFFAMMNFKDQSKLVSVKAVENTFPFYGELTKSKQQEKLNSGQAWLFTELSSQLNIPLNKKIRLGNIELNVTDFITRDPSLTFRAGNIAPRVYISFNDLAATGLIKYGSTYTESYAYALDASISTKELMKKLESIFVDPTLQFTDAEIAGESAGKQIAYLSDYLGLVSIVAVLLSLLGSAYIFKLFLNQKIKEIAILKSLGMQSNQAVQIYLLVNLLLSVLSIPFVIILTNLLLPLIQFLIQQFSTIELKMATDYFSIYVAIVMAIGGGLLVNLPLIGYIRTISTVQLLGEESKFNQADFKKWWLFIPLILFILTLTVYVAQSFKLASYFLASLFIVSLFVLMIVHLLLFLARKNVLFFINKNWQTRYIIKGLIRRPQEISTLFLTITIGALLINLMPQLKTSIQSEFQVGENSELPSLFLFDIQDDQIDPLKDFLQKENRPWTGISPMVRSRIIAVNDVPYERTIQVGSFQTREQEQDARFRNRGVNLSYRDQLSKSETLVEGKFWQSTDPVGDFAQLSIEKSFADRLGMKLGDFLTFDIQGIEIKGKVTSFRKVKWASFEPNFFILVQPGFLEMAPKIFIMSISKLNELDKNQLQNKIAKNYANVSIIDVSRTVGEVLKQAEKMSWSLELMAWLALLTGYIVLFSIIRTNMQMRRWEWNMLKILGTNAQTILKIVIGELLMITVGASLIGILLSHGICYLLAVKIFEGQFSANLIWSFSTFILINLIAVIIGYLSSQSIANENPKQILTGQIG